MCAGVGGMCVGGRGREVCGGARGRCVCAGAGALCVSGRGRGRGAGRRGGARGVSVDVGGRRVCLNNNPDFSCARSSVFEYELIDFHRTKRWNELCVITL